MLLKIVLVFCILQNATPIPYKHGKENNLKHLIHYGKEKINAKTLFKEESEELSSESRRLFDWIKQILNKNDTKEVTQKTYTYEEVMNERLRFRQLELNLTDTLTKLSHVLNQILNIVKYSRYTHFEDIHEFLPTKLESKKAYRCGNRIKRGFNEVHTVTTEISVGKNQKYVNEKNYKSAEENHVYNNIQIKVPLIETDDSIYKNVHITNPRFTAKIVNETLDQEYLLKTGLEAQSTKLNSENLTTKDILVDTIHNYSTILENKTNTPVHKLNDMEKVKTNVNLTKSNIKIYVPAKKGPLSLNIQETRVKRETKEVKLEVDNKIEVKNKNSSAKIDVTNNTTDVEIIKNSRRAMLPKNRSPKDEVKKRLFQYIDDAFEDITKKIDSLKQTKLIFANDASYQIGYIISNIDTLEVNLRNMKRDMDKNKYIWDDKNILNLYDTVKVSDKAISDLMEILKNYVEKSFIN